MRARLLFAFVAMAAGVWNWTAHAGGKCDLDRVIGYQLLFSKTIEGYIQNGIRRKGYDGCEQDRVLVFTDNTGVRCKDVALRHIDQLPVGYLFFRGGGDMKLCVEGELFDVTGTN